jgi:hypothetical protein
MSLEPTIKYLNAFFEGHIVQYREMMRDAGSARYPELYEGRPEAIQMIREMVHGIEEEFANMEIPKAYSTPNALRQRLIAYRDMGRAQMKEAQTLSAAVGETWPSEIGYAYRISNEVADAIDYALTLSDSQPVQRPTMDRLLHVINALPEVANQLTKRRKDNNLPRPTLEITDEYDVQDLLHSLLLIDFSDVRSEEWTPSFAGATKRTDFLLHDEEIVIEVKKTRSGLTQRVVSDELTIDIAAYQTHPRAKHLVCVVWDRERILKNPTALKKDLEMSSKGFATVIVLI